MSATAPYPVPAGRRVTGTLRPPPSKSLTHRYLNLALLAGAPLEVGRPLFSADTELFLAALQACGFGAERGAGRVRLTPPRSPRRVDAPPVEIFCGNAGTMLRFVTATLAALPGRYRIDGTPRLRERPVAPLVAALRDLGADVRYLEGEGFAPLAVRGGSLVGGRARLDAGASSQYLSALLMAALGAEREVEIEVAALTSEPYVALTRQAVVAFAGHLETPTPGRWRVRPGLAPPAAVEVEGDYSAACYPAAAAALTGGHVRLVGLARDSAQGDRGFFDLLQRMGAEVAWVGEGWEVAGSGALTALAVDLSALPDQVPTLAALAPFSHGTTRIGNVAHLRIKESDRLAAMARELGRAGAAVEELPGGLVIPGVWAAAEPPAAPVVVDPHDDHRIAMSLAVAGLRRPGLSIAAPEVVGKSYPRFWRDLESLLGPPAGR